METTAGLTAVGTEGGGTAVETVAGGMAVKTLGCTMGDKLGVCWRHVKLAWGRVCANGTYPWEKLGEAGAWCPDGRAFLRPGAGAPTSLTSPFGVFRNTILPGFRTKPSGKARGTAFPICSCVRFGDVLHLASV